MALSIKDPETEKLARALAARTGETVPVATHRALQECLTRMVSQTEQSAFLDDVEAMQRRLKALPILDDRSPDEFIGYDENGLPS